MNRAFLLCLALAVVGCLPIRNAAPVAKRDPDFAGVPIVRVGMRQEEVDHIAGASKCGSSGGGSIAYMMWWYPDNLSVDTNVNLVVRCSLVETTVSGPNPIAGLTDVYLNSKLTTGMSPAEVAAEAGPARYGVETETGTVELLYPRPGIVVEYSGGVLARWRRVVRHEEKPVKENK
ncbi:hypothetical protein [Zavarzinella formosa]|uniref:hypothetical protein n=1 Tax=Zavarzinella formosa TaxID=360055 RepID=UPI00037DEF4F|nr:hypothetical protein [Zavarzinella formosa]